MSYVATRGGATAIAEAAQLFNAARAFGPSAAPLDVAAIEAQLPFLHGRVLSEGGLYAPELAGLAIKQALGDPLEAALILRARRASLERLDDLPIHSGEDLRIIRRISAAFKDVPGGQMLGLTSDYLQRLFRYELLDETPETFQALAREWLKGVPHTAAPETAPKLVALLRREGLLPETSAVDDETPADITRTPLVAPIPRSAALAALSQGETGGLLALAYSNMRGYGDVHPTVAELRVGYLPVNAPHPVTGEPMEIGEVLMTECEIVARFETPGDGLPRFTLGYGACFGHNEVKAIAMAVLDRALQEGAAHGVEHPSQDMAFVLGHIDGVDAVGFCTHYKLPHHVTFQADIDQLRAAQANRSGTPDDDR